MHTLYAPSRNLTSLFLTLAVLGPVGFSACAIWIAGLFFVATLFSAVLCPKRPQRRLPPVEQLMSLRTATIDEKTKTMTIVMDLK